MQSFQNGRDDGPLVAVEPAKCTSKDVEVIDEFEPDALLAVESTDPLHLSTIPPVLSAGLPQVALVFSEYSRCSGSPGPYNLDDGTHPSQHHREGSIRVDTHDFSTFHHDSDIVHSSGSTNARNRYRHSSQPPRQSPRSDSVNSVTRGPSGFLSDMTISQVLQSLRTQVSERFYTAVSRQLDISCRFTACWRKRHQEEEYGRY